MPENLREYPVKVRHVRVGERQYEIVGPANYEELIDDPRVIQRFERDEFLPYWAEFWPACVALAEVVASWPRPAASPAPVVLELGCGLGLVSLVAAERGYRAIASDYDDDALAFVAESARRSGVHGVETRWIDWRKGYADLRCDCIVGAEVLYEKRNLEPIARFIERHLVPGGKALLVDANRQTADAFPVVAGECGLIAAPEQLPAVGGAGARLFVVQGGSGGARR